MLYYNRIIVDNIFKQPDFQRLHKLCTMAKNHPLNISQYYSLFKKIQKTPSILSDSDQLTIFIVANALLEGVDTINDLKELILKLRERSAYRYFTQTDFLYTEPIYNDLDPIFENNISNSLTPEATGSKGDFFREENDLIEVYKALKHSLKEKQVKVIQCLWIVFDFLDLIEFDIFYQLVVYLNDIKINKLELKKILAELEDSGFIYTDYDNILLWDLPQAGITEIEGEQFLLNNLRPLIQFFIDEKEFRLLLYLGTHFYSEDLFEDANLCYEKIVQHAIKQKEAKLISGVYNNWGLSLAGMRRFESACAKYKKAIEIKNDYAQPYKNWGSALIELYSYEEATRKLQKAINIEPSYIDAYYEYGRALANLKEYEAAHEQYKNAIKLNPNYVAAYNNDGNVLVNLEKYEEASLRFKKVIEIDPEFGGAYFNLARVMRIMNYYQSNPEEVFELLLKAFFFFIIRREWKFARKTAVFNILKEEKKNIFIKNVVYVFNIGIECILNPDKKQSNKRIDKIKYFRKKTMKLKKDNSLLEASSIVIDAILNSKGPPKITKDYPYLNSISVRAAVILANDLTCPEG